MDSEEDDLSPEQKQQAAFLADPILHIAPLTPAQYALRSKKGAALPAVYDFLRGTNSDGSKRLLTQADKAAKKLLASRRTPMRNPDIYAALKAGGLVLQSKEPINTIGSVLTRRFLEQGDIVRVDRGVWGLKEWYPGRSFKAKADGKDATETSENE